MYLYASMIVSTCFCSVEGLCVDLVDVVLIFCSPSEQTTKSMNLSIWEITFLHYFIAMRDTAVEESVFGIL